MNDRSMGDRVKVKSSPVKLEIISKEQIPFAASRETWISRFKKISPDIKIGQAVKVETDSIREANLIRASWRRVNLDRKPRSKILRDFKSAVITIYLWVEKS